MLQNLPIILLGISPPKTPIILTPSSYYSHINVKSHVRQKSMFHVQSQLKRQI